MQAIRSIKQQHHITGADVSAWLGTPCILYMAGIQSEMPLAWWTEDDKGQLLTRGGFLQPTGLPLGALLTQAELTGLPADWSALLDMAPYLQWQLLQAMLSSPLAAELALSNPLLFILLVSWAEQQGIQPDVFTTLVGRKRTYLLQHIGLPPSGSILKILSRCQLMLKNPDELKFIHNELSLPGSVSLLRHVPHIGMTTFIVLAEQRTIAWPGLLKMLDTQAKTVGLSMLTRLLRDTRNLGASQRQLEQTQNLAQLHELHDKLVQRFNKQSLEKKSRALQASFGAYPAAPLAGTDNIQPLISWLDLLTEGARMHHCVGSYAHSVQLGKSFVYRVTSPERLTLALSKHPHGWEISEVKGFANSQPADDSMQYIRQWHQQALIHNG